MQWRLEIAPLVLKRPGSGALFVAAKGDSKVLARAFCNRCKKSLRYSDTMRDARTSHVSHETSLFRAIGLNSSRSPTPGAWARSVGGL